MIVGGTAEPSMHRAESLRGIVAKDTQHFGRASRTFRCGRVL